MALLQRQPSIGVVSTHVSESCVTDKPVEETWAKVSDMSFSWWPLVQSCTVAEGNPKAVGSTHVINFSDGQMWTIQLREFSEIRRTISFDIIASEPSLSVTSALHTISLIRVTSDNSTFVQWTTDFSNDADTAIVEDSRFKKLEAFAGLS